VKFGLLDHFIGRVILLLRILRMEVSVILELIKDSNFVIVLGVSVNFGLYSFLVIVFSDFFLLKASFGEHTYSRDLNDCFPPT
jgi:accessory gene regulator protein AgrB